MFRLSTEPGASPFSLAEPQRSFAPLTVPSGKFFLMGDNHDNRFDFRFFGFVDNDAIIGKTAAAIVSWDIKDTRLPRTDRFFTGLRQVLFCRRIGQ
jgi:hypothetical protein